MKKIILMTLCLVSIAVQAQQVRFIPKAGLNIANMTNAEGFESRFGLNAGVSGEIMLSSGFAVEPGVFYSMQGVTSSKSEGDIALKNDYINVPVLAKYYVYDGLNLFAGPKVGFLINSKVEASVPGIPKIAIDTKERFKTIDFGLVLGVGYQTAIGLNFSASYNLGLANVLDKSEIEKDFGVDLSGREMKHNVIQVSVGWRF